MPRDNLKESVYLNYAAMTNTPINPKSWLYEENVATYEYNPTMATTFLKNSGWTDTDKDGKLEKEISGIRQSLRATILVNQENTGRVQIASKLKEELTAIGFVVTLDKVDFEIYQQSLVSGQFDLDGGRLEMLRGDGFNTIFRHGRQPELYRLQRCGYGYPADGGKDGSRRRADASGL